MSGLSHWVLVSLLSSILTSQSDGRRQYLKLAEATLQNPISSDELRRAIVSPDGIAALQKLFEKSLGESLVANGALVTPELGGEATLVEGRLRFVIYPDPIHPILREMVALKDEPSRLLALLESSEDGRFLLENTGGLHVLLYQMSLATPDEHQHQLLESVLQSAVSTYFKTWTADPQIQARMIEKNEWHGRYVGFWHIHPPRFRDGVPAEGIEPSVADMTHAIEMGQFLTIVFQPDGFDAYDLSPMARARRPDLSKVEISTHRSPEWRRHFEEIARMRLEDSKPE